MEINQRMTQGEWLGHTNQRVVDSRVTVGVIARHRVASDTSTLHKRAIRAETLLLHIPNNAAVYGL